MHLLLKWNPTYESDTCDQHRAHAAAVGTTWWSCDSESEDRRVAPARLDQLSAQDAGRVKSYAFVYRTGDEPADAEVWRARILSFSEDPVDVDPVRRPPGMRDESGFLFVELADFEAVAAGWILDGLERWDEPRASMASALRNQTSPIYVALRRLG
jgi:hypothetical protein